MEERIWCRQKENVDKEEVGIKEAWDIIMTIRRRREWKI